MRIISFSYTTAALLAGAKSCTRRDWNHRYAQTFQAGERMAAYNRSPRFHGDHVATIRLLAKPTFEPLADMPDSDYDAEGFAWLSEHPESWPKTTQGMPAGPVFRHQFSREGFNMWRYSDEGRAGYMWVVRFALESIQTSEGWRVVV